MADFQKIVSKADFNIKELTYAIGVITETVNTLKPNLKERQRRSPKGFKRRDQ